MGSKSMIYLKKNRSLNLILKSEMEEMKMPKLSEIDYQKWKLFLQMKRKLKKPKMSFKIKELVSNMIN